MPLYEFQCPKCKLIEEFLVSFKEGATPPRCSVCGEKMGRRVSSFTFKVWHYDVDGFWRPGFAEAQARKCGVET